MSDPNDLIQQKMLAEALASKARTPAVRSSSPAGQIAGEGVSDTAELLRLLTMLKQSEASSAADEQMIVIGEFSVSAARVPARTVGVLQGLTRMEAAVLRMLGWGRANNDIAMLLDSTENTVRTHMNNIIRKLELDGMRELMVLAGLLFHPLD